MSYVLADTNSLVFAYKAGGTDLLDLYRKLAKTQGYQLAISGIVFLEIEKGPLGAELTDYIVSREVNLVESPITDFELAQAIDDKVEFDRVTKNAGERSLIEIAARENAEGRGVMIWSDDGYFASPQIRRQMERDLPNLKLSATASFFDHSHRLGLITEAEYKQHVSAYLSLKPFQDSPRLRAFDPALTGIPLDPPDGAPSVRGPEGQRGFASGDLLVGESPQHTLLRSAGLAMSGVDAIPSVQRIATHLDQDNPAAARSEARHTVARNAGGWIGGASAGAVATAAASGPGAVGFIVIGGAAMAGAKVGDHVATVLDSYEVFQQQDRDGVQWRSDGRQWVRQDLGDMTDDGANNPVRQRFSADREKAEELSYLASNVAMGQAMGQLAPPRNPYSQPAADGDAPSLRPADWKRDPASGDWGRTVVTGYEQRGLPMTQFDKAGPERAAELDRAAAQVIGENIANGPVPMAARYERVHRSADWQRFGPVPAEIQSVLREDALTASDGQRYLRDEHGQWLRGSGQAVASAELRQELESTRAALQPDLARHRQELAAVPARAAATLEDIERADLLWTYQAHGVAPGPEQLQAALEAVRRTQQDQGVAALATSLHLAPNARGGFDVDSPIQHIGRDADGANRVQAVTTALEVQLALLDQRSPLPSAAEPPELRVAHLSPQQHDALEQVVREANRLGLVRDEIQQAAKQAVAMAGAGAAADRPAETDIALAEPPRARPAMERSRPASDWDPDAAAEPARWSHADQAMFGKVRAGAPATVPDEYVAAAVLAAKRNGIADADSIGPVGVANGKLWLGAQTPGFHTGVSLSEPAPALQDALREAQAFNQQREQKQAQDAVQRTQDEPGRGPRM